MSEAELLEQQVPVVTGLEAQTRGEIDIQIATAKRYPRSVAQVMKSAMSLVELSEEVAEQCFYAVPRDGKTIEGPSARLAEIMASCWGHMRSEARVVEETDTHVVSRGTTWDLERNVAVAFEVRRRITNRQGKKYGDDMITTTSNAANSIAYRNSVLRAIPKAFWQPVYDRARKVAIGDAETLVSKRTKALAHFGKMGVSEARVFTAIGVNGIEDVTLDKLATLKGIAQAIKEGDTTVDDAFPELVKEPQRMQTPPADAPPVSAPAATTPAETSAASPSSSPAEATGTQDQVTDNVSVVNTAATKGKSGAFLYAITTSDGMFYTQDEALYSPLAVIEGADHTARLTWRMAKLGGQNSRVLVAVHVHQADAGGAA